MQDEWISAQVALTRVSELLGDWQGRLTICQRAHAGLVQAKAVRLTKAAGRYEKASTSDDAMLPNTFWWAEGKESLEQTWETGDFGTSINDGRESREWKAFGVRFRREDIEAMLPEQHAVVFKPATAHNSAQRTGRPKVASWNAWIAELALHVHENGLPTGEGSKGQEALISAIAERLAKQGIEGPSRSTVQGAAQAVLDRVRSAG